MLSTSPILRPVALAGLLLASLTFTGCNDDDNTVDPVPVAKQNAVTIYANIVSATYEDALTAAQVLDTKAQAFVATPSAAKLDEVKAAWKAAREPYNQTDAFRFYGGPIDDADGPEGLLNAWPLDENYIDYTDSVDATGTLVLRTVGGIINDAATYPSISKSMLADLNEQGGEKNISVGYHAVEFLLWGQDFYATSAGRRPYTDYLTGAGATAPNGGRRGQYLLACTSLIVDQLQGLVNEWKAGASGNYRAQFLALPTDSALYRIGKGLGSLSKGELAGERMQVALDNRDQEDEHSCFSDNTDRDLKGNEQGIWNVLNGSYKRIDNSTVSGASLLDAVRAKEAAKADALKTAAQDALTKVNAIQAPFDQEVLGADSAPGRQRVRAAVLAARAQADQVSAAYQALGITLVF